MTGLSRARTQIVPPQDILDNQVFYTEKWTLYGLGNAIVNFFPTFLIHSKGLKCVLNHYQ